MRKIFTILCAALMSVGMWAEPITVTWNNSDISGSGNSFTKDGVTITCGMNIDWDDKTFLDGGTFTTNLGNFTKIEVTAGDCGISGEGWSGSSAQKTWTGNAASVSYSGEIMGMEDGVTFVFTIEPASTPEPAKYYIVGNMNTWGVDENYEMNPNIYAETEEYFYALDLTTTSQFKVVKVENGVQSWFPEGMGNNYGQNGEITEDGEYTVYFRPNYDGGEDWFYNCIYVSKNEEEPLKVVFEANGKKKEVEVELPHTFWCDLENENGELDLIIQELYALPQGGYCDYYYDGPVATGNPAVTAGADEDANHFITISEAFEGTATVSGKYNKYTDLDEEDFTYTLTISIKDTSTAVENVQTNQVQSTKILRDGMLLIEKNGVLYNVMGTQVR